MLPKIPGYTIKRTLGKGGMATVYLALQESAQREVALKVLDARFAEDASFGKRFTREAQIVSRLNHPNIVSVYDVGVYDDLFYIAMEYVDGPDLKSAQPSLNLAQKVFIIRELATALIYAQAEGIVHRDIKSENILLYEPDLTPVLMDFGIARGAGKEMDVTQTGTSLGTPHYMSPEQARGEPVDHRSDLYSLGVLFYFVLVGEVPFKGGSAVAVGINHITKPIPKLPLQYEDLQFVIDKLLAKKPEDRFQSAELLIDYLDKIEAAWLNPENAQEKDNLSKQQNADKDSELTHIEYDFVAKIKSGLTELYNNKIRSFWRSPALKESKNIYIAAWACLLLVTFGWILHSNDQEQASPEPAVASSDASSTAESVDELELLDDSDLVDDSASIVDEELELDPQVASEASTESPESLASALQEQAAQDQTTEAEGNFSSSAIVEQDSAMAKAEQSTSELPVEPVDDSADPLGELIAEIETQSNVEKNEIEAAEQNAPTYEQAMAMLPVYQQKSDNAFNKQVRLVVYRLEKSIKQLAAEVTKADKSQVGTNSFNQNLDKSLQRIRTLLRYGEFDEAQHQFNQIKSLIPELSDSKAAEIENFLSDVPQLQNLKSKADKAAVVGNYVEPKEESALFYNLQMLALQSDYIEPIFAINSVHKNLRDKADDLYSDGQWGQAYQYLQKILAIQPQNAWAQRTAKNIEDYQRQINEQRGEWSQAGE